MNKKTRETARSWAAQHLMNIRWGLEEIRHTHNIFDHRRLFDLDECVDLEYLMDPEDLLNHLGFTVDWMISDESL